MTDHVGAAAGRIASVIRGGLIVSCQALPDEPLFGSAVMAKLAVAAQNGGAVGIRANTPDDIAAIRRMVDLPIIGLWKIDLTGFDVYITPRLADAVAVAEAGADVVAIDATARARPEGPVSEFIRRIRETTGKPVLADVSTVEEARAAQGAGADFISTTMSGYTPYSPQIAGPDIDLVKHLAQSLTVPVFAEGRIGTPAEARAAMDAGAFAVIVGGAITRPHLITRRFVEAIHGR